MAKGPLDLSGSGCIITWTCSVLLLKPVSLTDARWYYIVLSYYGNPENCIAFDCIASHCLALSSSVLSCRVLQSIKFPLCTDKSIFNNLYGLSAALLGGIQSTFWAACSSSRGPLFKPCLSHRIISTLAVVGAISVSLFTGPWDHFICIFEKYTWMFHMPKHLTI